MFNFLPVLLEAKNKFPQLKLTIINLDLDFLYISHLTVITIQLNQNILKLRRQAKICLKNKTRKMSIHKLI